MLTVTQARTLLTVNLGLLMLCASFYPNDTPVYPNVTPMMLNDTPMIHVPNDTPMNPDDTPMNLELLQ